MNTLLTIGEVAAAFGASSKRPVYRAIARARADGRELTVPLYGKTLVPKKSLAALRQYYYPIGSKARKAMAPVWGKQGGITRQRSSSSDTTGKAVAARKEA
jgi:hypothetical protein